MSLAVLLIEDDADFAQFLVRYLRKEEFEVEHAATGEDGLRLFSEHSPDVVLLDLFLPDTDGMRILEQMRTQDENAAVIVMTAHASVDTAVEAMRLGALEFATKPIDLDALSVKLDRAAEFIKMRADLGYFMERERREGAVDSFIGESPQMQAVYDKIRDVATTDNTTVLVTGESGTGKELVARAVHNLSSRSDKPLMQVDCTSIPLSLLESELFGHERGAFTGADRTKKGLLELADGGTLLLDEIGDMPLELQSKLLRVLQERNFRRVGGTRDLRFDVRVVAATNQDLEGMCDQGRFRRDLLFRLKVFQIQLPALRDRGDDVIALAEDFCRQYAQTFRKTVAGLDRDAYDTLRTYPFPGNVRELRNIMEQAVILSKRDRITHELLSISTSRSPQPQVLNGSATPSAQVPSAPVPAAFRPGVEPASEPASMPWDPPHPENNSPVAAPHDAQSANDEDVTPLPLLLSALGSTPLATAERELIKQALNQSAGSKKLAAELLGISRFALQRKLEKLAAEALNAVIK